MVKPPHCLMRANTSTAFQALTLPLVRREAAEKVAHDGADATDYESIVVPAAGLLHPLENPEAGRGAEETCELGREQHRRLLGPRCNGRAVSCFRRVRELPGSRSWRIGYLSA